MGSGATLFSQKDRTSIPVWHASIPMCLASIYDTLKLSENDTKDVTKVKETLEDFAKGIVNETLERYVCNCKAQESEGIA